MWWLLFSLLLVLLRQWLLDGVMEFGHFFVVLGVGRAAAFSNVYVGASVSLQDPSSGVSTGWVDGAADWWACRAGESE